MGLLKWDAETAIGGFQSGSGMTLDMYVYHAGSERISPIYRDRHLLQMAPNPQRSDTDGRFDTVYLQDGLYRIVVKNRNGEVLADDGDVTVRSTLAEGPSYVMRSVTELLADRTLSVTQGRGRFPVAEGSLISVAEGAHNFVVQSAESTQFHVQTAGGLKLQVLAGPDCRYHIDAFGAVGDGATDDTAAFVAFQKVALAAPNAVSADLHLTPGRHYLYSDNHWAQGFRKLRIFGHGARLECTAATSFSIDSNALNFTNWNSELNTTPRTGADVQFQGHLIASAAKNQAVVTTLTAADAGGYAAGDWVLIYGFANQVGGAPMDARYFEYRKVASADAGTGRVTLTEELAYDYNANWPKLYAFTWTPNDAGPPRILKLQRANRYLTERLEVRDVVFTRNRNRTGSSRLSVAGVLSVSFHDCDMADMVELTVGDVRDIYFERCDTGEVELDKLTCRAEFKDCNIKLLAQGVGTIYTVVDGGTVRRQVELGSRHVILRNVILDNVDDDGGTAHVMQPSYTEPRRVESLVIDNCTVLGNRLPLLSRFFGESLAVSSLDGSNNLVVAKTNWANVNHIYTGMRLASVNAGALFMVSDIEEHDAANIVIRGTWETAVPALPVTLYSSWLGNVEVRGCNHTILQKRGQRMTLNLQSDDPAWSFATVLDLSGFGPMRPSRIACNVLKASSVGGSIWFRNTTTAGNALVIDAATAGMRQHNAQGGIGSAVSGADVHTAGAWTWGIWQVNPRTGGNNSITGTPAQLPIFNARVDFHSLLT